jgi:hypothetical protein
MTREFDDLIETGGLTPEERRRLESIHEMLVAAGPPPELPAALREPPAPTAEVVELASRRRSRRLLAAVIAAALAVSLFAGGYALGDRGGNRDVVRVMPLEGVAQQPARAEVSLHTGEGGNWPMELKVTGLPQQEGRGYYELFVWRNGKPRYPCVGFKMKSGTTTVRFTVPYELKDDTQLRVTVVDAKNAWPGKVVMRTA